MNTELPTNSNGQTEAVAANAETSALDELVHGTLTAEPAAFERVVFSAGTMDAKSVRAALLRLQEAGKAELNYGQGWRRIEAGL